MAGDAAGTYPGGLDAARGSEGAPDQRVDGAGHQLQQPILQRASEDGGHHHRRREQTGGGCAGVAADYQRATDLQVQRAECLRPREGRGDYQRIDLPWDEWDDLGRFLKWLLRIIIT